MPITANDIVIYGSQIMPEDDAATAIGGAIDSTVRIIFADLAQTGNLRVVSDDAGDTTQTVTITGRGAAGVVQEEMLNLKGTTAVIGSKRFEHILKIRVSAAHAGTIHVEDPQGTPNAIADLEPGLLEVRQLFYGAFAEASSGADRKYYEKVFARNNHPMLPLVDAVIEKVVDPLGKVAFGLAATLDDDGTNGTGNNRLVAPPGIVFDASPKKVANGQNHTAGAAQGIWFELTANAGDSAAESTYTIREFGTRGMILAA